MLAWLLHNTSDGATRLQVIILGIAVILVLRYDIKILLEMIQDFKNEVRQEMLKRCKRCGKKFSARCGQQKYCSAACRGMSQTYHSNEKKAGRNYSGQPCWRCKNTSRNCSWIRNSIPVDGWTATPTETEGGSYKILFCPNFALEER